MKIENSHLVTRLKDEASTARPRLKEWGLRDKEVRGQEIFYKGVAYYPLSEQWAIVSEIQV